MPENGLILDIVPKFSDSDAEYCFRKYHNFDAISRSQSALRGILLFNIWLISAEYFWQISHEVSSQALEFRLGAVLIILCWMITSLPKFNPSTLIIHPLFYCIYGFYLIIMHSYLSYQQIKIWNHNYLHEEELQRGTPPPGAGGQPEEEEEGDTMRTHEFTYLFYNGRWSLADALVYVLLCFNTTLRFGQSASLSGSYILLFTVMPFLLNYPIHSTAISSNHDFHEKYSLLISPSMIILFTFYLLCLVSSQDIEMKLRMRFLKLSELGHALRRRDMLINSILPKEISIALRKGDSQQLSAYYQNVSILFCSIVDFGRHSSISHAEDIVRLLIRIVSMFDRITSHFGVYKVENIADTYMCCSGLGLEQEQNYTPSDDHPPEHPAIRIARAALAMRQASEYFNWRWPDGSPVTLKIGIHTGHVNAGVIGTRSYSYHLFGDAVNTASRMCSHSLPGQIGLSRTAVKYIRSINKNLFLFQNRGRVNVKGKGEMLLFWLDGCKDEHTAETSPEHVYYTNTRQDFSQNIGRFLEESESASSIAIRPFDLTYVNITPNTCCSCLRNRMIRANAVEKLEAVEDEDMDLSYNSTSVVAEAGEWFYYNMTTPTFRYQILRIQTRFGNWWRKDKRKESNSTTTPSNRSKRTPPKINQHDNEEKISEESHHLRLSPRPFISGQAAKINPMDDTPAPLPTLSNTTSTSGPSQKSLHRLGSSKHFSSSSSLGSQVSTVGPLVNSRFTSQDFTSNEQMIPQKSNSSSSIPIRRLSASSLSSSQSSHQQVIEALTVRRYSSSEASVEQGLSAEDALMVNKLRKASNRPGTFFRLNTINSSEFGSNSSTPKVTSRPTNIGDATGHDDSPNHGSSGKSSSGRSEGNGLFDRFLSRSSSISLSTSKSYSSKISMLSSHDGERISESDPYTIQNRLRKNSKNSPPTIQAPAPVSSVPSNTTSNSPPNVSLPSGISPSPPNSGQIKSIRPKFRRSISDPDDGTFTGKSSGGSFNPTRARSFDISESNNNETTNNIIEEKETKPSEQQYASGTLRKGSLHALEFFLSKAGSKASSWVSSNSNEPRLDSSAKRERMRREASQAQIKKYDAFADHSGLQHQISTSDSHLLSDADRLEIHFQDTYNHDNIGQFKRVLVLVALYQSLFCIAGAFTISNALIVALLCAALIYFAIFPKNYNHIQLMGALGTMVILILHVRQESSGVQVDTVSQIFTFAIINIHLRVRFKFSCLVTLAIHTAILARIILSPQKFASWKIYGNYSYSILVSIMTLFQSYVREKAIRENYKHLQILQEDTIKSQLLLENMLPKSVHAKQLLLGELVFDELHDVTLLYSDIKGFTPLSATMDTQVLTKLLNLIYSAFDRHLEHFGLYKVDTIGDAFVVVGGLPGYKSQENHAMACLQFAFHMQNDMKIIRAACEVDIELRIGIHTGSVIGSVISLNKPRYLVWGSDTQVANAMESTGIPGAIHLSHETAQVLDNDELQTLNITLLKRPPDENIQNYTEFSYIASCSDIGLFFHDTWSHFRLSRANGNGAMNLLISPETNESSIFEVMSTLAKQLLNVNSTTFEGKNPQSIDDFDDFMTPSPSRIGTRRTRGDSLDESEVSSSGLPPRQKKEIYSGDEQDNKQIPIDVDIIEQNPSAEIQSSNSRGIFHSASKMLRKFSLGAPHSSTIDDTSNSYSELITENLPTHPTLQHQPSQPQYQRSNHKLTFVERSILQQDITRGQIVPSSFKPVTIIWNKRLDVKERNLIINNYTSGTAVHEGLLLDNSALPSANGHVSISISTPKKGPPVMTQSSNPVSPINSTNRSIPWSTIRQTLEEGSGSGSVRVL